MKKPVDAEASKEHHDITTAEGQPGVTFLEPSPNSEKGTFLMKSFTETSFYCTMFSVII